MSDPHTEARVREAVSRVTGRDASRAAVRRLAGHASMRSYWRVGTPPESHVVMVLPAERKPEEVTKGGAPAVDPFVDVQRYLAGIGVRVPAIRAFLEPEGLMVLEDLGDEMLETRLLAGDARRPLYERATSTAGSSSTSSSGGSRPGRGRGSRPRSGPSATASSIGSRGRSRRSPRGSPTATTSRATSWSSPTAPRR